MESMRSLPNQEAPTYSEKFYTALKHIEALRTKEEIDDFLVDLHTNKFTIESNEERMKLDSAISKKLKEYQSTYPGNLTVWNTNFRTDMLELYKSDGLRAVLVAIQAEVDYINQKDNTEENNIFITKLKEELKALEEAQ